MSNEQHTPGPWSINEWPQPHSSIAIGAAGAPLIARVILRDVSINGQKANARRIVACVNACEKIPTSDLERSGNSVTPIFELLMEARTQRDELMAALEGAEKWMDGWASTEPYLNIIRAAIAKAKS